MKRLKLYYLIFAIVLIPMGVFASAIEPDYVVKSAYIDASFDIMGSMHVREIFVVDGAINGYKRVLEYKNANLPEWEEGKIDFSGSSFYDARGVSLSKFSSYSIKKSEDSWDLFGREYEEFEESEEASKGDTGVYTKKEIDTGVEVSIYNQNKTGYVVYYFDYYVDQVAVMHKDIGEVYFTFFKLDSDDVENVKIQVTLPFVSSEEYFRTWAHGSLNGEISRISNSEDEDGNPLFSGALASLSGYKAGSPIEIRMTFDRRGYESILPILNYSDMYALKSVIKVETERANDANKKRTIAKGAYYGSIGLGITYLLVLIGLWIYVYKKYDKEYDVGFDHKYYRDFTGDYDVEVVDYLMNKSISTKAFSASIMNLIYKHNIDIEENPNSKGDLTLILKDKKSVSHAEATIINLLFSKIGSDKKVTLKEIEKYSSKYSTAKDFMDEYETWKVKVESAAISENFFETHGTPGLIAGIYLVLGWILIGIIFTSGVRYFILPILIFIDGIAFFIYALTFKKWTRKGREHYLKWKAFKNFLLDFGSLKDKEIPEIKLWDKYLVYATVLGVAKEVQKSMQIQLSTLDSDDLTPRMVFSYNDFYMMNTLNKAIDTSYTKSMTTVNAELASSSMSSGGGFGGGFSSGGGSAGGGGGGGGF